MSTKQNKAILQRIFSELNRGNFNILDEIFAEDFADRYPAPGEIPTREGFKQVLAGTHKTFPDWHFTIEDIIAEEDRVAYRFSMRGTDTGGFMGMPPTGKQVGYVAIGILRFANGKVVERWAVYDSLTLFNQLGLV